MFNKLICWFTGHVPDDDFTEVINMLGVDFNASICKCCDATLVYNEQLDNWVKW